MAKGKNKVIIDTNIFIYGWFSEDSNCIKILDMISDRKIQLLFSQETIGELVYVTKNFVRHNIPDKSDQIEMLKDLMMLFYYGTSVNTIGATINSINDEYDEMFLKCAIKGKADYLISNDFKSGMHEYKGIKVVSSKQFVDEFEDIK